MIRNVNVSGLNELTTACIVDFQEGRLWVNGHTYEIDHCPGCAAERTVRGHPFDSRIEEECETLRGHCEGPLVASGNLTLSHRPDIYDVSDMD